MQNFYLLFVEIDVQIIKKYFEEYILEQGKAIGSKLLKLEKKIYWSLHQPIDQEISCTKTLCTFYDGQAD